MFINEHRGDRDEDNMRSYDVTKYRRGYTTVFVEEQGNQETNSACRLEKISELTDGS